MRYTFLGDKMTRPELRAMQCNPVRRPDGKCVVCIPLASALVVDANGKQYVVPRRRLRLNKRSARQSRVLNACSGMGYNDRDVRAAIRARLEANL